MKYLFFILSFLLLGNLFASDMVDKSSPISVSQDGLTIQIMKYSPEEDMGIQLFFPSISDINLFDFDQLSLEEDCTVNVSVTASIGIVSITLGANDVPCGEVGRVVKERSAAARAAIM